MNMKHALKNRVLLGLILTAALTLPTSYASEQDLLISGVVVEDKHANGETIEAGRHFSHVLINLIDEHGDVIAQTRTDKNGQFEFPGLKPGIYQLDIPIYTGNESDTNRLLLGHFSSPTGSSLDIELASSPIKDVKLYYRAIDFRTTPSPRLSLQY